MKGNIADIERRAIAFDLSIVLRSYASKHNLSSEKVSEHEREIKRFLVMSAYDPESYGMAGPMDELWHEMVLHTVIYAKFCHAIADRFIHHVPEPPVEQSTEKSGRPNRYSRFLRDYQHFFGAPPPHLWPRVTEQVAPSAARLTTTQPKQGKMKSRNSLDALRVLVLNPKAAQVLLRHTLVPFNSVNPRHLWPSHLSDTPDGGAVYNLIDDILRRAHQKLVDAGVDPPWEPPAPEPDCSSNQGSAACCPACD